MTAAILPFPSQIKKKTERLETRFCERRKEIMTLALKIEVARAELERERLLSDPVSNEYLEWALSDTGALF